jgi:FAD synthetase
MTFNNPKKKVLVFGVFDCLHDGHRSLFAHANELGELCIVVTPDEVVFQLKNHVPRQTSVERAAVLAHELPNALIVVGDTELNSWNILVREKPDIILLGYDQTSLKKSLEYYLQKNNLSIAIEMSVSYNGDTLHSSMLQL